MRLRAKILGAAVVASVLAVGTHAFWGDTIRAIAQSDRFGAHLLHEEPDHTLAIFAGAWLAGRGAPPHNHGTWAVLAGVIGAERNTLWARIDDGSRAGYAEVRRQEDRVLGPGDVLTLQPDSIHSVINDTTSVTI